MAFEGLSDRLEAAFQRLKSKGSLNEKDVKEAMREVRLALLEADVNYKVLRTLLQKLLSVQSVLRLWKVLHLHRWLLKL